MMINNNIKQKQQQKKHTKLSLTHFVIMRLLQAIPIQRKKKSYA